MIQKLIKSKYFKIVCIVLGIVLVGYLIYVFGFKNNLKFRENEEVFLNGVKKYFEFNESKLPSVGNYKNITLAEMYDGEWISSTIYVPGREKACNEDSYVRVINDNGAYRYIVYLDCDKYDSDVDHTPPVITLKGESSVILLLNSTYQDLGIEAVTDDKDKIDVSKVIIDSSKVNTSKIGNYEVTYKVYDSSFNVAKATRQVVVTETLSGRVEREKGNGYVYKGEALDNYVLFSGMMWRIVGVNSDDSVKLITDNNIANVNYGGDGIDYKNSNVYTWLNEYFYNNINEASKKYIVDSTWCYDTQEQQGIIDTCNNSVSSKVGLLSLSEFERSKENNLSYLIRTSRFYFLNKQNMSRIWVSDLYNDTRALTMHASDMVGVRPVINISKDIFVTSGSGTLTEPFKLQDYNYGRENDLLNTRLTGEYVVYSGNTFRIAGVDEDGNTRLVAIDLLEDKTKKDRLVVGSYDNSLEKISPNPSEEGNLYFDLNQEVINQISETFIVSHEFEVPKYKSDVNYKDLEKVKVTSKIGLPASYEMFSGFNDNANFYQIYWLSDYKEEGIITIINGNNGIAFNLNRTTFPENALKIVIYLKSDLKIASGKGTVSNPYYVR